MTSKIVPREPTTDMLRALDTDEYAAYLQRPVAIKVWRVMYDAAPAMEKPADHAATEDADDRLLSEIDRYAQSPHDGITLMTKAADRIAELRAERDVALVDAKRWATMAMLWGAYVEVDLRQDETGSWSIACRDAVESFPDHVFVAETPDAAIDAALKEGK